MNYITRLVLHIVLGCMLAACAYHKVVRKPMPESSQPKTSPNTGWRSFHPKHFSRVDVQGPIHLKIVGTQAQRDTLVCLDNPAVTFYVKDETLFIRSKQHQDHAWQSDHPKPGSPYETVKLFATDLRAVHLTHGPAAMLENIRTRRGLTIIDETEGDLILKGHIVLRKLIKHYPGLVRIDWVDSDCLNIEATEGHIQLAGVAGQAYIDVAGVASADLRSLRVRRAFVKTHQQGHVNILALQSLHAFADDRSSIDYYKYPKHLSTHTRELGRIVQVAAWR